MCYLRPMYRPAIALLLFCLILSCGSQPESDQVGQQTQNMQYSFSLNPAYTADTTTKKMDAVLYLYSALTGLTQCTLALDGTRSGETYRAAIYDEDSSGQAFLSAQPRLVLGDAVALDSLLTISTNPVEWNFDSITQHFTGYLVVYDLPEPDTLRNQMLLIRGRIAHP